jgi:hypothetical protein
MFIDKMVNKADTVHIIAEEFHCASAIMAVEELLTEFAKDADGYYTKLEEIKNEYRELRENYSECKETELNDKYKNWKESASKYSFHIRIAYSSLDPDYACLINIADKQVTIALPECHIKTIREGLSTTHDTWTQEMIDAKDSLRRLTVHELAHILTMIEDDVPTSVKDREDAMEAFTERLLSLRDERLGKIHTFCEASTEKGKELCPNRQK